MVNSAVPGTPLKTKKNKTNITLAMFSKHFLRCGCTAVGSFVCDRISSNSSSDKK